MSPCFLKNLQFFKNIISSNLSFILILYATWIYNIYLFIKPSGPNKRNYDIGRPKEVLRPKIMNIEIQFRDPTPNRIQSNQRPTRSTLMIASFGVKVDAISRKGQPFICIYFLFKQFYKT